MNPVSFLLYVSQATTLLDEETHLACLEKAVLRSVHAGVTGQLLFRHGFFMQYLEGTEATVHDLFRHIRGTYRHFNVRILSEGTVDERLFTDWSAHWVREPSQTVSSQGLIDLFETVLTTKNPTKNELNAILRRFGQDSIPMPLNDQQAEKQMFFR
ncbi:MAG: hypothetical protein RJB66_1263 [Pseudomonadota bacterium]|jgi:hypothetical protein